MEERLDDAIHVLRNHAESSPHLPPGHPAMQGMMGPPPTHSNGLHMPPGPPGPPHHVGGHYPGMPPHHMPPHHPHMESHMVCIPIRSELYFRFSSIVTGVLAEMHYNKERASRSKVKVSEPQGQRSKQLLWFANGIPQGPSMNYVTPKEGTGGSAKCYHTVFLLL